MKSEVKNWLLKESWSDLQDRIRRQTAKSKSHWVIRTLTYIFTLIAFLFLLTPDTTTHVIEKYTGIETPLLIKKEEKVVYAPPLFDPIEDSKIHQRRLDAMRVDSRFSKIHLISLMDQKQVPEGSEVLAKLSSGGTNGLLKAELSEDLIFDGVVYLPRKTILMGQGTSSDERLFINFKKAIRPGSRPIKISAQGFDFKDRLLGLKGKKVSDYAFKIAASSGLILLGAVAESLKSEDNTSIFQTRKKSLKDAALDGVATSTTEQGKHFIESMDHQNRIEVGSETKLIVIFDEVENGK